MNVVIEKLTKQVLWINPDPNRLSGEESWSEFRNNKHQLVYCTDYNPKIGDTFKAEISNGQSVPFQAKVFWNKDNMSPRQVLSYDDEPIKQSETDKEPLFELLDGKKIYKRYQKFDGQKWIVDIEAEYEASIPKTLTPAQAEIILHRTGKLQAVEEILADPNTPVEAKIYWKKAQTIERDNTYLNTLAAAIGLNKQQIDNLFIEGAKIK